MSVRAFSRLRPSFISNAVSVCCLCARAFIGCTSTTWRMMDGDDRCCVDSVLRHKYSVGGITLRDLDVSVIIKIIE